MVSHPVQAVVGPLRDGGYPLGEPHTMAAGFEDMHLGRHPGTTQCHLKYDGVFNGHRLIIGRVKQERWGILFRHTLLVGQLLDQLGIRIFAEEITLGSPMRKRLIKGDDRITKDGKIRPAADAIDRIFRLGIAPVEMSRDG